MPIVALLGWEEKQVLILSFALSERPPQAIVVDNEGRLSLVDVSELRVERPNEQFPLGYSFSKVQSEGVPA